MNVRELSGVALDWAAAKADGLEPYVCDFDYWAVDCADCLEMEIGGEFEDSYSPTVSWDLGGPLIHKHGLWLSDDNDDPEQPHISSIRGAHMQVGPTPLVAAMRALVASKLGDEIEVPDELA